MIGIIDSGIGGTTIFKEIIKVLPKQKYIYYSDSINNPYGDKKEEELLNIVDKNILFLINKGCKVIVLACNTISMICFEMLKEKYPKINFIETHPAYELIQKNHLTGSTLIMATKNTIESDKFKKIYNKYNDNKTFVISCSGLAELIENNEIDEIDNYLNKTIVNYKGVSNIVLGCTHYPLIKKNISKVLGNVIFLDSSKIVTQKLKEILIQNNMINNNNKLKIEFYDSSNSKIREERFYNILKS